MVSEPPTWFVGGIKVAGVQMKTWLLFCRETLFQHLLLFWLLDCFCKPGKHLMLGNRAEIWGAAFLHPNNLTAWSQPSALPGLLCLAAWFLSLSCIVAYFLPVSACSWPRLEHGSLEQPPEKVAQLMKMPTYQGSWGHHLPCYVVPGWWGVSWCNTSVLYPPTRGWWLLPSLES